jgi:cytochrome c5
MATGLIAVSAAVLFAVGAPSNRKPASSAPPLASEPASVSADGFTLVSTSAELPFDDRQFPDGPHADVVNANCLACHSTSMVLTQPVLKSDQWKAIVIKMRDVYKAPVAEENVAPIVDYLATLSAKQASGAVSAP